MAAPVDLPDRVAPSVTTPAAVQHHDPT